MTSAGLLRLFMCVLSEFAFRGVTPQLHMPQSPARGGSAWTSLLFDQGWFSLVHRASFLAVVA